jgi:hypothetical protein
MRPLVTGFLFLACTPAHGWLSTGMTSSRSLWLPVTIAALALAWRMAKLHFGLHDTLANFAPWMALAFAGSMVMPKQVPFWLWPAVMLGCDMLVHPQDIGSMWLVYACFAVASLVGSFLRDKRSITTLVGGTLACSLGFYLITSTQAWWLNPVYAKSAAGWLQALTVGDPSWQPQAWVFALRSLLSDLGFGLLLVIAYNGEANLRRVAPLHMVERTA